MFGLKKCRSLFESTWFEFRYNFSVTERALNARSYRIAFESKDLKPFEYDIIQRERKK